jgi:hypothetical protein
MSASASWPQPRSLYAAAALLTQPLLMCRPPVMHTRSGKVLGWSEQHRSWTNDMFFGWHTVPSGFGRLAVGDTLAVLPRT